MPNLPKILIVDDEANILQALRRVLRRADFDVEVTTSPTDALRMVQETTYAIVVSDQRMPELTGTELLAQVRVLSPDSTRIILTGYADIQAAMDAINRGAVYRYLSKPWSDSELKGILRQALDKFLLIQENRRLKELTEQQTEELKGLNETLKKRVAERTLEVVKLNQLLEESFLKAVQAMARMSEIHSPQLGSHGKRVAALAKETAKRLGLARAPRGQVEVAAMLHDIGKIHVDPAILRKPEAQRSEAEQLALRDHPALGAAILRMIPRLEDAVDAVRHHHERIDGRGYPDGLAGDAIPFGARIIAAVDAYDRALNDPSTFGSTTPTDALEAVRLRTPDEFDPRVVEALGIVLQERAEREGTLVHALEIDLKDLRPGMVLARDLLSQAGRPLIKRNSLVLPDQIEQVRHEYAADSAPEGILVYRRWPLASS